MEHDPARKTYAGHGKPSRLCYHGRHGNAPDPVVVLIASSEGMVTLTNAETGKGVNHFGVATKFWAHPVETPTVQCEACQDKADDCYYCKPGPHNGGVAPMPVSPDVPARKVPREERPEVWFTPAVVPGQEFRRVPDAYVTQLLAILDSGTVLELHPDGWWRDSHGLTGPMLDTVALRDAVRDARAAGLVYEMAGQGRHIANPTVHPAVIHRSYTQAGGGRRPLCLVDALDLDHLIRFRMTDRSARVTCNHCKREAAGIVVRAEALTKIMADRGVTVGAEVTYPGSPRGRIYTVSQVQEDQVKLTFPHPTNPGDTAETGWLFWTMLRPVKPVAPAPVDQHSYWSAQAQMWESNQIQR